MTTHTATLEPSLPLLAKGFRLFFLLAALYAAVIVPLWLAIMSSKLVPGSYLPPATWHAHEMTWGFVIRERVVPRSRGRPTRLRAVNAFARATSRRRLARA
jgi:hypothetical protein